MITKKGKFPEYSPQSHDTLWYSSEDTDEEIAK